MCILFINITIYNCDIYISTYGDMILQKGTHAITSRHALDVQEVDSQPNRDGLAIGFSAQVGFCWGD